MTSLFPARRRAERFDSMVEGGRRDDVDRATSDLLELVGALRSAPEPQARPEFVADLRERLLLAAESELATVTPARERDTVSLLTVKPSRTRRERRVGIALGAAAILGATTSMAVASQGAIPGDALYPVKRAIENTQTGFSVGDDSKGETILGNASGRLDEVDTLTHQSHPDAELVTETLNTFSDQATDAADHLMSDYEQHGHQQSIVQLHQFTAQSMAELGELEGVIPAEAHDALLQAAQSVFAIDAAAVNLCPDCGDGLTEIPAQVLAGATTAPGDEATDTVAGGELPGTEVSSGDPGADPTDAAHGNAGKGHGSPSGLNPPETPIQIPPNTGNTGDVTTGPGDGLPAGGTDATTGAPGTTGGTDSVTGGGGKDGKGGKGGVKHPVDLTPVTTPVTTTVTEVVTGVVSGVAGLLNGLTGN